MIARYDSKDHTTTCIFAEILYAVIWAGGICLTNKSILNLEILFDKKQQKIQQHAKI